MWLLFFIYLQENGFLSNLTRMPFFNETRHTIEPQTLKFIWNNSQSGYFLLLCTPARKIYVLIWRNNVTPLSNPLKCAKPFSFMNRRKWRENKKLDKMPHNVARLFSKVINIFKSQIAESSKWCFAFKIW